jgi:tRNA (adenine37-N6)-methyltransferase
LVAHKPNSFTTLWTRGEFSCDRCGMNGKLSEAETELRPGEVAVALPPQSDAGVYFIGTIRTPWRTRQECPKRGSLDGPICSITVDERWREGLTDLAGHPRIQVLYWMHRARRDLVLQTPFSSMQTTGTFALRSPVRPNPIASSIVELVAVKGATLEVRGLDCVDGTPLIDLKPERGAAGDLPASASAPGQLRGAVAATRTGSAR